MFAELIKDLEDTSYPRYILYTTLGSNVVFADPPQDGRLPLLREVWKVVTKFSDPKVNCVCVCVCVCVSACVHVYIFPDEYLYCSLLSHNYSLLNVQIYFLFSNSTSCLSRSIFPVQKFGLSMCPST